MTEDETIESRFISKRIEDSQEKVEKHNFDSRRNLLEYDDVLNQQRTVVYDFRREILEGEENILDIVQEMMAGAVQMTVADAVPGRSLTSEGVTEVIEHISRLTSLPKDIFNEQSLLATGTSEQLQIVLIDMLKAQLQNKLSLVAADKLPLVKNAHKWIMLETIDQAWKQHMLNLDHLKEGISLRSWGQKNPLIEYKREAFGMFEDMMRESRTEVMSLIFHLNVEHFNSHEFERKRERELEELSMLGPDDPEGDIGVRQATSQKIGRNDDCPCGSGKKYKKCCGKGS